MKTDDDRQSTYPSRRYGRHYLRHLRLAPSQFEPALLRSYTHGRDHAGEQRRRAQIRRRERGAVAEVVLRGIRADDRPRGFVRAQAR